MKNTANSSQTLVPESEKDKKTAVFKKRHRFIRFIKERFPVFQKREKNLEQALRECRKTAHEGYAIANDNLDETEKIIHELQRDLSNSRNLLENLTGRNSDVVDKIKSQLKNVGHKLVSLQSSSRDDLEASKKRLDKFSITLFGRTMAGKSTFMEILTCGDGRSIGLGAQRTTKDVRSYLWRGLQVTDVPGIAAFEGNEDEELAISEARQADLVIFLITDDAPQPIEAEFLAKIVAWGKPVFGIFNVKMAWNEEDGVKFFLKRINKKFQQLRIKEMISQFHQFLDQNSPVKRVNFYSTHLHARYLAQQKKYVRYQNELLKASHFNEIESSIVYEVAQRGSFLRIKNFIDAAVVPMLQLSESLVKFSEQNSKSQQSFREKVKELKDWLEDFRERGTERLETLISKVVGELEAEASNFAEDPPPKKAVAEQWKRAVRSLGIEDEINNLQQELLEECKGKLTEVARNIESELSLTSDVSDNQVLEVEDIFDFKRAWKWGVTSVAGGLGIAAIILGSGPLGWAAAFVGLVGSLLSSLFTSKEKKRRELREKLYSIVEEIGHSLGKNTQEWFKEELIESQLKPALEDLKAVERGLSELAVQQKKLAQTLCKRQKALSRVLLKKALEQVGSANLNKHIKDIARIPGTALMLRLDSQSAFSHSVVKEISELLGEKVWLIEAQNQRTLLIQAIGRSNVKEETDEDGSVRLSLRHFNPTTECRIRLAQQLTNTAS